MATYTTNYNLEKPEASDQFGDFRTSYNSNMDIIDANLGGGGSGDTVSWTQIQTTGTKIAEIDINGTSQDVYAPTGGGGGSVNDVLVNGVSVVDGNGDAQITSYKEVTQAEYDALPSSKESDGVAYFIKDGHSSSSAVEESVIAPVETSLIASRGYAVGEQFFYQGVLYTATATISQGGTITINGNCTASDSITEQIGSFHLDKVTVTFDSNGLAIANIAGIRAGACVFAQRNSDSSSYQSRTVTGANCTVDGQVKIYLNSAYALANASVAIFWKNV